MIMYGNSDKAIDPTVPQAFGISSKNGVSYIDISGNT